MYICSYITAPDWKTYVLYGMSFVSWGANIELNPKYMTFKLQTKDIEYIKKQTKNIPTISQAQVFCSMSITPPCQIFRLETPWSTGALPNLENYEFQDSMAFLVFITSKWKYVSNRIPWLYLRTSKLEKYGLPNFHLPSKKSPQCFECRRKSSLVGISKILLQFQENLIKVLIADQHAHDIHLLQFHLSNNSIQLVTETRVTFNCYTSEKLTWHWKIPIFNRKYIFKWWMFHCHVNFRLVDWLHF